jgi:hypothetical protein
LQLPRAREPAVDRVLFNNACDMLERADAANVKAGGTPAHNAIILISRPGNIAWQLTVSDAGALSVSQVPAGAVPGP